MTNSIYDKYNSNPLTTPATTDLIPVVDVSDTTESSDGTTKGMQLAKIQGLITAATTSASGQVELATSDETNTGTDATLAVTPDGLDDWTGSAQVTTVGTLVAGDTSACTDNNSLFKRIAAGTTTLFNNVMYLFPSDFGAYANIGEVMAAVPEGGVLCLMEDYRFDTYGQIAIDHSMTITSDSGWATAVGSVVAFDNFNGTPIDTPFLVYDSSGSIQNVIFRNVYIEHDHSSSAAVDVTDVNRIFFDNTQINCKNNGDVGIKLDGATFYFEFNEGVIRNFNTCGIQQVSTISGWNNWIHDCSVISNTAGCDSAIDIYAAGTVIERVQAEIPDDVGVRVIASSSRDVYGVRIKEISNEQDYAYVSFINNGSGGTCRDCRVEDIILSRGRNSEPLVYFDHALNCTLSGVSSPGPITSVTSDFEVFETTANAENTVIKVGGDILAMPYTDAGVNTAIELTGADPRSLIVYNESTQTAPANSNMFPLMRTGILHRALTNSNWESTAVSGFTTPADIASCTLWLDADNLGDSYSDSGAIDSNWADQSGSGNNFTSIGSTSDPIYYSDPLSKGYSSAYFDGSDDYMTIAGGIAFGTSPDQGTVIAVVTPTANTSTAYWLLSRDSNNEGINLHDVLMRLRVYWNGNLHQDSYNNSDSGDTVFVIARYDGSLSAGTESNLAISYTESPVIDAETSGSWNDNSAAWDLGRGGASYFKGHIHALCLFDEYLSDVDAERMTWYFMNKYKCITEV